MARKSGREEEPTGFGQSDRNTESGKKWNPGTDETRSESDALRDGGGRSRGRDRNSLRAGLDGSRSNSRSRSRGGCIGLGGGLVGRAIPGDVAGLRTLVADLAGGAQWATIGGGAVTRDVALLWC